MSTPGTIAWFARHDARLAWREGGAGRYLHAAGASKNLGNAIFSYNHAWWYVQSVLLRAKLIGGMPDQLIGALTGLVQGHFPVAAPAKYADDAVAPADPEDLRDRVNVREDVVVREHHALRRARAAARKDHCSGRVRCPARRQRGNSGIDRLNERGAIGQRQRIITTGNREAMGDRRLSIGVEV